jgi:hypothetical protein
MKISIIADDRYIIIDGRPVRMEALDIDPMYHAVQFDTDKGWGEIEYKEIDRDGAGPEPAYKPRNEPVLPSTSKTCSAYRCRPPLKSC